jgi:hypothetical protein
MNADATPMAADKSDAMFLFEYRVVIAARTPQLFLSAAIGVASAFIGASKDFRQPQPKTPKKKGPRMRPFPGNARNQSSGTISSATMLMILMSGFTAGPAVSL